jgi:hypothetical protein
MEDCIPACFPFGLPTNLKLHLLHNSTAYSWSQARPNETVSVTESPCISRQVLRTCPTAKSEMGASELNSVLCTAKRVCGARRRVLISP